MIDHNSYKQFTGKSEGSKSYPGIISLHNYHVVSVKIIGLPNHNFTSFEKRNNGYLITEWSWVPIDYAMKINDIIDVYLKNLLCKSLDNQ